MGGRRSPRIEPGTLLFGDGDLIVNVTPSGYFYAALLFGFSHTWHWWGWHGRTRRSPPRHDQRDPR